MCNFVKLGIYVTIKEDESKVNDGQSSKGQMYGGLFSLLKDLRVVRYVLFPNGKQNKKYASVPQ